MDSFFEAQRLVKKYGDKKALQYANYNLWHKATSNLQKAYQRAVMYYIERKGERMSMIVKTGKSNNRFGKKK